MRLLTQLTLLTVTTLAACSSFNHYTVLGESHSNVPSPVPDAFQAAKEQLDRVPLCPEKKDWSELPEPPNVPLAQLRATRPGDDDALDSIMLAYMNKMKLYGRALRQASEKDQRDYHDACMHYREAKDNLK